MIRLLIADDEMIERAVLYKTLQENLGDRCVVYQAENGREALDLYREHGIQIAVLDIEMPGINGIEAAERIREQDKDCCIIFLTAFDEFSYAKRAISVRALDYVLKPYDEKELMLVMEEAVHIVEERMRQQKEQYSAQPARRPLPQPAEPEQVLDGPPQGGGALAEVITRYVRENYMYDISMQDLARQMNYSEAYFCKLFKQCFGRNFTAYLTDYRVNEAKKQLAEPTVNVKEVGRAVGYTDSNYFAKVFKRVTGQSPTEYRIAIFQNRK